MTLPSWRSRCSACVGIMLRCPDSAEPTLPPPSLKVPTNSPSRSTMPSPSSRTRSRTTPTATRRGRLPRLPLSEWRGPGQQHCPSLPPPHFQWMEPGIIARAAANLGLAVPMPQAPRRPNQLHGIRGLEAAIRPARLDPIWPMFGFVSRHQTVLQWGCGGAREARGPGENIYPGHEDGGCDRPGLQGGTAAGSRSVCCLWSEAGAQRSLPHSQRPADSQAYRQSASVYDAARGCYE